MRKISPRVPLSRRTLLKGALTGAAGIALTPTNYGFATALTEQKLHLRHMHTGEMFSDVVYCAGQEVPENLQVLEKFLRDHHTNERHAIDPKLVGLMVQLQGFLPSKQEMQVISGYRAPKTNARLRAHGRGVAKNSYHMQGKAVDIRVPAHMSDVYEYVRRQSIGGLGYYKGSNFIHMDVRGRFVTWGDRISRS